MLLGFTALGCQHTVTGKLTDSDLVLLVADKAPADIVKAETRVETTSARVLIDPFSDEEGGSAEVTPPTPRYLREPGIGLQSLRPPPHWRAFSRAFNALKPTNDNDESIQRLSSVDESAERKTIKPDELAPSAVASSERMPSVDSETNWGEAPTLLEEALSSTGDWQGFSFHDDIRCVPSRLRDDAAAVANWNNAAILGTALAGAIIIRQDLDREVRDNTRRHPRRWGDATKTLGRMGEVQYHVPVLLGVYAWSVKTQDEDLHEMSTSLISAYTISGLTSLAIKGIANTDRPSSTWNGGQFGFPSFHTSSTFSMASVLDEYYGHKVGIPAFAVAGLIGWSRIDDRDHDLSDVVFGAALGYVIGKSVSGRHLYGDSRVRLRPYVHATEPASGVMVDVAF